MAAAEPDDSDEMETADDLLTVTGLSAGYLGEDVVHSVDLSLKPGEAVAIIGANGAGKTTLLRAVCGLLTPSVGRVRFDGVDITGVPAHRVVRSGLVYVPAERRLFPQMSVQENLSLGAYPKRPDPARRRMVYETFPRLEERAIQAAGTLSGGEQQMLAVGRALMSAPSLLVLDEPTTGLAPLLAQEAYQALAALRGEGLTVLVAEQQVPLALQLADRAYVVDHGRITIEGSSEKLAADPDVRRAYLGI